jgi:DNA-directed RNA polymerase subunit N (RpoN/RPB10)
MLYMKCSCGKLLGHLQPIYEDGMRKICEKFNMDYNVYSIGEINNDQNFRNEQSKLLNSLCTRYCCKIAIMNYVDIVNLIK